jgi:hypothetical protein
MGNIDMKNAILQGNSRDFTIFNHFSLYNTDARAFKLSFEVVYFHYYHNNRSKYGQKR